MPHTFCKHGVLGAPASRRPAASNRNFRAKYAILAFFRIFRQRAAETAAFPGQKVCGIRRLAGFYAAERVALPDVIESSLLLGAPKVGLMCCKDDADRPRRPSRAFVFFVFNPGFPPLRGLHPGLCCSALFLSLTHCYAWINLTTVDFSPIHIFLCACSKLPHSNALFVAL